MADSPISFLHPGELRESPENPREIAPERFEALKHSLRKQPDMMLARPVIADTRNATAVAGNMRLRACLDLIEEEPSDENAPFKQRYAEWGGIPTFLREFTDAEKREWMLRDNQEYGNWVPDELAALVSIHEAEGSDLGLLGFSEQELRDIQSVAGGGGPDMPDEGDAPQDDPTSVWGIVIDLDSEPEQVALLEEFAERGLKCRALLV